MLQKLGFLPGFNKQVTETGAEGQWFDGDNVRFRYGTPEKIGGWQQLGESKLTGAARAIHHWDDNAGIKYAAIGTNRILYVYSGGTYYDIHPIRATLTGANFTSTSSSTTVTVTCSGAHGLADNDIVLFDSVSGVTAVGSTYTDATFEDKKFMVTSVPTSTTFEITMDSQEAGTPLSTSGSASVLPLPLQIDPASRAQPLLLAKTSFFSAVVKFFGLASSASVAPHKDIILSYKCLIVKIIYTAPSLIALRIRATN